LVKTLADAAGHRDVSRFGAHSTRRSKAARIYAETKDIEAVKHLLGHTSLAVTERYLGVSQEKALEVSRQYDF
jgi:integrase